MFHASVLVPYWNYFSDERLCEELVKLKIIEEADTGEFDRRIMITMITSFYEEKKREEDAPKGGSSHLHRPLHSVLSSIEYMPCLLASMA